MPILRSEIERALDDLVSQEEGMRFQGLAVVLGKKRWPCLVAHPRKKDLGLDAYVPAWDTPEKIGKGLAASITPDLGKVSRDAERAKENYPDLGALLFVTPAKVGKTKQRQWEEAIRNDHGLELLVIEREEIIVLMTMQENASLCATYLHLHVDAEPDVQELVRRTRGAAEEVAQTWARKAQGQPLIELGAVRVELEGGDSAEVLSLEQIDEALSQSGRIVLEGPAGRGKTTTLLQLAQRERRTGIPFMVDLSPWDDIASEDSRVHCRRTRISGRGADVRRARARTADGTIPVPVERLERNRRVELATGRRSASRTRAGVSWRRDHRRDPHPPSGPAAAWRIAIAVIACGARGAGRLSGSSPWGASDWAEIPHRCRPAPRRADANAVHPLGGRVAV